MADWRAIYDRAEDRHSEMLERLIAQKGAAQQEQPVNYAELLEKDYGKFKTAQGIIRDCRKMGFSDKEIYENLESFY